MTTRIRAIGGSAGVVIDRRILEHLKITAETELELSTDGERLVITPVRTAEARQAAFEKAQLRVVNAPDATFRKLAQ
jgi:antitoxin component of MazEF toxin-antitoxin module